MRMPICQTAQAVADSRARSSHTADEWHSRCRGTVIDVRGPHYCGCECHAAPTCAECGATDQTDIETGLCADRGRCRTDQLDRLHQHPTYQLLADIRAQAAKEARAAREAAIDPGECACCGKPTRGGQFLPGHDARHRGVLFRAAVDGDLAAAVELRERGWLGLVDQSRIPSA